MNKRTKSIKEAIVFLEDAAEYFERRDAKGEDKAHWANVYNANNCREIQNLIDAIDKEHAELVEALTEAAHALEITAEWVEVECAYPGTALGISNDAKKARAILAKVSCNG